MFLYIYIYLCVLPLSRMSGSALDLRQHHEMFTLRPKNVDFPTCRKRDVTLVPWLIICTNPAIVSDRYNILTRRYICIVWDASVATTVVKHDI